MKIRFYVGTGMALLALIAVKPVRAGIATPKDDRGFTVTHPDFVGGFPCVLDAGTSTNAIECSSNTASFGGRTFDTTGRGEVIGVIMSSVTQTNYIVLRDTATANTASSTMTIVSPLLAGSSSVTAGSTVFVKFPIPLQYQTGLSANVATALTAPAQFTIIYRPFKSIE